MDTELGYSIHPGDDFGSEWGWQLDINLYQHPTGEHFDPERMDLWMVGHDGEVGQTTVTHPWHGQRQLRICTGRIILHDRKNKAIEAFSFGGEIEILSEETCTNCRLTSPVPIVELVDSHDIQTMLVFEFEALLAMLEAHWGDNEAAFKRKLAAVQPDILFAAGAVAIQARFRRLPATESRRQVLHFLEQTIQEMQADDKWPSSVPALADLL